MTEKRGWWWGAIFLVACGGAEPSVRALAADPPNPPVVVEGELSLVESVPLGTSLDHPDIPDAAEVWLEMIDGAQTTLDFLEFYGASTVESRLERVLEAIERAASRGVRVRFVFDVAMLDENGEVPARLAAIDGVEVRPYRFSEVGGGVQHAKLFIVDGREAFIGSQNFDWRSITHIQELGVRITSPSVVGAFQDLFRLDWELAAAESPQAPEAEPWRRSSVLQFEGEAVEVTPAASPRGWLPASTAWDWPLLREQIENAQTHVRVQVMSYHLVMYNGERWGALDSLLRSVASRGVTVQLLVSNWECRSGRIEDLRALQATEGVEVRMVTIPEAASGFIPYARTIHAKYVTVDGHASWLGTSNASGDYFLRSRNASVVVEGVAFAARLEGFFDDLWGSAYAAPIDPNHACVEPRVRE